VRKRQKQRYETGIKTLKTAFLCNLWIAQCQKVLYSRYLSLSGVVARWVPSEPWFSNKCRKQPYSPDRD